MGEKVDILLLDSTNARCVIVDSYFAGKTMAGYFRKDGRKRKAYRVEQSPGVFRWEEGFWRRDNFTAGATVLFQWRRRCPFPQALDGKEATILEFVDNGIVVIAKETKEKYVVVKEQIRNVFTTERTGE